MKFSHKAAVSILAVAAVMSVGSIGLVAVQFGAPSSAAQVVINTAVTSELNGVVDAVSDLPDDMRQGVITRHGAESMDALTRTLNEQRSRLSIAEQDRSAFLARNEKRLSLLLALTLFNGFALAMGAVSLFDAYRRHPADTLRPPQALKA